MEQAHGILLGIVRAEGVGADEFRKAARLVGVGADLGAHLMEHHGNAELTACQAASEPAMPAPMM
jgi:hypothetical protein